MLKNALLLQHLKEIEKEVKKEPENSQEAIERQVKCLILLRELETKLQKIILCN